MSQNLEEFINLEMMKQCPLTGRLFYEGVFHPTLNKIVPTYAKQNESYTTHSHTIPVLTPDEKGYVIQSYNHAEEKWEEPVLLHHEEVLVSVLMKVKKRLGYDNKDLIETISFIEKQYF